MRPKSIRKISYNNLPSTDFSFHSGPAIWSRLHNSPWIMPRTPTTGPRWLHSWTKWSNFNKTPSLLWLILSLSVANMQLTQSLNEMSLPRRTVLWFQPSHPICKFLWVQPSKVLSLIQWYLLCLTTRQALYTHPQWSTLNWAWYKMYLRQSPDKIQWMSTSVVSVRLYRRHLLWQCNFLVLAALHLIWIQPFTLSLRPTFMIFKKF
jgi:hypothetical protein